MASFKPNYLSDTITVGIKASTKEFWEDTNIQPMAVSQSMMDTERKKILVMCVLVAQSCLTLCNPMDCSPPGSSVHGILQARILEWVAISFSREASQPRDRTHASCIGRQILYHLNHLESPLVIRNYKYLGIAYQPSIT